jgi:hypothetical protein
MAVPAGHDGTAPARPQHGDAARKGAPVVLPTAVAGKRTLTAEERRLLGLPAAGPIPRPRERVSR